MIIRKRRIRNLNNYISSRKINETIVPCVILDIEKDKVILKSIGFTEKLEVGETLLPKAIGPITTYNADGREVPDKTKPKETRYREIEWCWEQWSGYGQTETVCDFKLVPYERWQRIFFPPPSIEVTIAKKDESKIYICTPQLVFNKENEASILHRVNLILEVFGSCYLLSPDLIPPIVPNKRLNWQILPPGKRPWKEQKALLQPLLDLVKEERVKPVVEDRLEDINDFGPDFTATGSFGFEGYVVFGFTDSKIFVLESAFYGNAIYVFNENWENLSKKTKAEVLQNGLVVERITHTGNRVNWIDKLRKLLTQPASQQSK